MCFMTVIYRKFFVAVWALFEQKKLVLPNLVAIFCYGKCMLHGSHTKITSVSVG